LKRLLLPALFAVALSSCIGVQSQLSLGRDGSERGLSLDWVEDDWYEVYRFAAVRK